MVEDGRWGLLRGERVVGDGIEKGNGKGKRGGG